MLSKFAIKLKEYKAPFIQGGLLFIVFLVVISILEPAFLKLLSELDVSSIFQPQFVFISVFSILAAYYVVNNIISKRLFLNKYEVFLFLLWLSWRVEIIGTAWYFWDVPYLTLKFIDLIPISLLLPFSRAFFPNGKQTQQNRNYSYGTLVPDIPLDELAISKGKKITDPDVDIYNRRRFAKQIANVITDIQPIKSFCIGFNGPWGYGKTSLWKLVENEFVHNNLKKITYSQFSPWLHRTVDSLVSEFFSHIDTECFGKSILSSDFKRYSNSIIETEKSILGSGVLGLFAPAEQSLEEQYEVLRTKFNDRSSIHVLFIDDLDRMDAKEIYLILRLVKKLADFPNLVYVIAYDRSYVDAAIGKYITTREKAKDYMDKIIQIEFTIPEPYPEQIRESLFSILDLQLNNVQRGTYSKERLKEALKPEHLGNLGYFIKSERDVRRFANIFIMHFKPIWAEVIFEEFFKLTLINYKFNAVYKEIYFNKGKILSYFSEEQKALRERTDDGSDDTGLDFLEAPEKVINLVSEIFRSNGGNSINNPTNFHKYFSLSLISGIHVEELEAAVEQGGVLLDDAMQEYMENFPDELYSKLKILYKGVQISDAQKLEKLNKSFNRIREICVAEDVLDKGLKDKVNPDKPYKPLFDHCNHENVSLLLEKIIESSTVDSEKKIELSNSLFKLQCSNFFFFHQKDKDSGITDHYFYKTFDLNEQIITVKITPHEFTNFWRFGFKLSKNAEIPEDRRHHEGCLVVCVDVGELIGDSLIPTNTSKLVFEYRKESKDSHPLLITDSYGKEEVTLRISKESVSVIYNNQPFEDLLNKYSIDTSYNHLKIFGWADYNQFVLNANITVEKRV